MWNAIREAFGEDPVVFKWSGLLVFPPDYFDIDFWGKILAAQINTHDFKDGEKLNIVAHSHGGNVVKEASWYINRSIDNLVTLGTPQNYDLKPTNSLKVKNHCNISSMTDMVQVTGSSPRQWRGIWDNLKTGSYYTSNAANLLWKGDFFGAARDLSYASYYFAASTAWFMSTKIDNYANKNVILSSTSHGELHSLPVWNKAKQECGL